MTICVTGLESEKIMRLEQHIGLGYASSTEEELEFIVEVSKATGVVLDPVYSGKAARGMVQDIAAKSADGKKRKVLFIHTGGLLGLYEKADQLAPIFKGGWRPFSQPAL